MGPWHGLAGDDSGYVPRYSLSVCSQVQVNGLTRQQCDFGAGTEESGDVQTADGGGL
jgi:hypothetical protein